MMKLKALMQIIEELAPLRLAESWDNCGLLLGDPSSDVHKVLSCLTLSHDVAAEAIAGQFDAIISHHPILFRATKSIRADKSETAIIWSLARAGIAVISHHTAWDGASAGANHFIAQVAGAEKIRPLQPSANPACVKFVVFAPQDHFEVVRQAAFDAGAGQIGLYDQCSFSGDGQGTFRGQPGANPTIGNVGQLESVPEKRLEVIALKSLQNKVLEAIRLAHSYEEPAIDIYDLAGVASRAEDGVGRVGDIPQPVSIKEIAAKVITGLKSKAAQLALALGVTNETEITRIAIGCGAGDDLIDMAIASGAQLMITGELRFHTILKARDAGISVLLTGHYSSERVSMEFLANILQKKCPDIIVRASAAECDPLQNFNG
jgi:dinuclear metal center YbgI/SA1388 family protein